MDESDKRRVLNAKLEWDLALEAATRKRTEFCRVVHELYYGPKRRGDSMELAQLLGKTSSQVKRYADGLTSGNLTSTARVEESREPDLKSARHSPTGES